jgi:F-box/leucine-rich repeat protein 2/20
VTSPTLACLPLNITSLNVSYCMYVNEEGLRLLTRLRGLVKLNVTGCHKVQSFLPLAALVQLEELGAAFCMNIKTLEGLSNLKSLRKFTAPHSGLGDGAGYQVFPALPHLTHVNLDDCNFVELGLSALPSLRNLHLRTGSKLSLLMGIPNVHGLHTLDLADNHSIDDKSLLTFGSLLQLKELSLKNCWLITDAGLRSLPVTLERLVLQGCHLVENAVKDGLARLTTMRSLDLHDCAMIADEGLHNLSDMSRLCDLNLSQCVQVTDAGLFGLSNMQKLRMLRLDSCRKVTDVGLRAVASLKKIESLDFTRCRGLKTLWPLATLPELRYINLSGCVAVTDGSLLNLAPCRKLETIYTNHCKLVSKEGVAALRRAIVASPP